MRDWRHQPAFVLGDTRAAIPCVHELIADQAASTPNAVAIEWGETFVTYAELEDRAWRLAGRLADLGVGPDQVVGLFLKRSPEMVVAMLGILKAGGAYLPVDPAFPRARIELMLSDAAADVVVTDRDLIPELPAGSGHALAIEDADGPLLVEQSQTLPEHLAYLIYTSGSTGIPKGVMIEHRSLSGFLESVRHAPGITSDDRFLALATLSFDMAMLELFLPLVAGATIRLADDRTARDPRALQKELAAVTMAEATPSTWRMLIDSGWEGAPGLTAISGGERLTPRLAEELLTRCDRLWNLYGPTEATVYCTRELVRTGEPPISIGVALENATCHILDERLVEVKQGDIGELYVGGDCLARGYLNRPELMAERFIANPYGEGRLYKTGDLARYLPDGRLECLGRSDHQVKIAGHRIELGEVEHALERLDSVAAAVAVAREVRTEELELHAYVVLRPNCTRTGTDLRRELLDVLPAYMVPAAVVIVDRFPLTPNGKVDRAQLPAPGREQSIGGVAGDPLERRLIAMWEEELQMDGLGTSEDLFSLGVSSLATARLFTRVERELNVQLPRSALFEAPSIRSLAELLRGELRTTRWSSLVPLEPSGTRPPLFVVHGGAGTVMLAQPLARRLGEDQPVYGFQARGLHGRDGVLDTIESIAAHYLTELRDVQPHGPYMLLGYCFGAAVVYEMAQRLLGEGEPVGLLAMVNGPTPAYLREHDPTSPTDDPDDPPPVIQPPPSLVGSVRNRVAVRTRIRRRVERYRISHGLAIPEDRRNSFFLFMHHKALRDYRAKPYPGPILLFRGRGLYSEPMIGWNRLCPRVELVEIPTATERPREAMAEPHVAVIAERIERAVAAATEPEHATC